MGSLLPSAKRSATAAAALRCGAEGDQSEVVKLRAEVARLCGLVESVSGLLQKVCWAGAAQPQPFISSSPYLRGFGAGAAYLDIDDRQGRTFQEWADRHFLRYSVVGKGKVRTYRKADIDALMAKTAHNTPIQFRVA